MPETTQQKFIIGLIDFIAGTLGGTSCTIVAAPLDTIKVKMQTFPYLYKNGFQCFKETLMKDGIRRGLYAGTVPSLIAQIAEKSVLFCAYGYTKDIIRMLVGHQKLTVMEEATAGSLAAFFSGVALCPAELIKCKLQVVREQGKRYEFMNKYIGPLDLTKETWRTEGLKGFYRGLTSTIAREMFGYFFFFAAYEKTKFVVTNGKHENYGLREMIITGGVGGSALWMAIYPFDLIKSKLQVEGKDEPMYVRMIKNIKEEGFRSLYSGIYPTLLRAFMSFAALGVTYEFTKLVLTQEAELLGWIPSQPIEQKPHFWFLDDEPDSDKK